MYFLLISFFLALCSSLLHADYYILIPGTWASEDGWHTQRSMFYQTLQKNIAHEDAIIPFYWAGNNTHKSRIIAGEQCALLLNALPEDINIYIIAHSHGGNVALLACMNVNRPIEGLCLLGTPINLEAYPVSSTIKRCYSLFSWQDFIQPVFGYFDRIIPLPQCCNIALTINAKEPNHTELHDPIIAQYLPTILKNSAILAKDYSMLCTAQTYTLVIDENRAEQLELDADILRRMTTILRRTHIHEKRN